MVVGNWKFVEEKGNLKSGEEKSTGTVIYVVKNKKLIGSITLEDKVFNSSNTYCSSVGLSVVFAIVIYNSLQ